MISHLLDDACATDRMNSTEFIEAEFLFFKNLYCDIFFLFIIKIQRQNLKD